MPYIHSKGSPDCDVWVLITRPLPGDVTRGYVFSSGLGYVFDKMMQEAGLDNYHVTAFFPDTDNPYAGRNVSGELNQYKPKIILPLDACGAKLCDELIPKRRGKTYNPDNDSEIEKYCGSLLTSPDLKYPHYVMPLLGPGRIAQLYKLRDQVLLDMCKAKHELDYAKTNSIVQPLPTRDLIIDFSCFDEQLYIIDSLLNHPKVSADIETIYPKKGSKFYGETPGVPIIIGLATSKDYGISVDMFRESISETRELWRRIDNVFRNTEVIGQNFYNFDMYYLEMLGFEFTFNKVHDTLIRHHTLWPELPHSLQYMTRQYTREPYYKDEGQGWTVKDMSGYKRYNCLDATVTYEVFENQEEEFDERPHLR